MKVLFFLPYSLEAAGCRYRVHQFLPFLEAHGVQCELRELVKPELYRVLYKPGHRFEKAWRFTASALRRLKDLRDARDWDVLFVHRECFPFGPALMERYLAGLRRPIVFDFDDAIYLSSDDALKDLLRAPEKTHVITQLADEVIVSNEHLRRLCLAYNRNVSIIPTSVETEQQFYARTHEGVLAPANGRPVRLGWIGSHSTAKYLTRLGPVLARVAARHPIEFLVVGAGRDISMPGVNVINAPWSLATEVNDFRSLDIGLYPLADELWELGKAAFKTIQFMAVGVPCVTSRVGVAIDIVRDGDNGFLASSDDEWVAKICRLIEEPDLRRRMAASGRSTAVEGFSVASNAPKLLAVLQRAAERGRRSA